MKDLTKGNPSQLILSFTIPIFMGNLLQLLYSLVDTMIVGMTLKQEALAAVGATSTLSNLMISFLVGATNGFAIMTAKAFGAHDKEEIRKNVATTLVLGSGITLLMMLVSIRHLPVILRFLRVPDKFIVQGSSYIRVILMGMIMAAFYNICASTLRAIGDTVAPLIFLAISTLSNIALDFFFILGLKSSVKGAAWATVVAQAGAGIACFIYMLRRYPFLRPKLKDFRLSKTRVLELLKAGLSMGLMQSLVALGTLTLQSAINYLGQDIIVAHTGARKMTEVLMLPYSVLGTSMATYCGQNTGAGRMDRVKEGLKQVLIVTSIWSVIATLISYTIAPMCIRRIVATSDPNVINPAYLYLRIDSLFYIVPGAISVLRNSLQGMGDHTTPIFSSFIELVGKVLVAFYLAPWLKYMGIIMAEPIVWVLMVIPLIVSVWRCVKEKEEQIEIGV